VLLLFVWVSFHLVSRFSTAQAMTSWDVAALRFAGAFFTVLPIGSCPGQYSFAARSLMTMESCDAPRGSFSG